MTIKFSIRHHYKDVPIEISIEADSTVKLTPMMRNTVAWLAGSRQLIDKFYEQTKKLTEKEKEKP